MENLLSNSLRAELAVAKIKKLYENNQYVYHTNICLEFEVSVKRVFTLLKKDQFFNEIKAQNRKISFERNIQNRHFYRVDSIEKPREEDPIILREIRKKAKVVVKLANENDFEYSLFKSKAEGKRLKPSYKGTFENYVCGEDRSFLH